MPFFRHVAADADPMQLLDPDQHVSTPWGEPKSGSCDKCRGEGRVPYRCLSCIEDGSSAECPACAGRVEFVAVCPTCAGTGEIVGTVRSGVSAFPTMGGLLRYFVEREVDLDGWLIVELEGELAEEPDTDADSGALLVHPTEILTRHPIDRERIADIRRRLE